MSHKSDTLRADTAIVLSRLIDNNADLQARACESDIIQQLKDLFTAASTGYDTHLQYLQYMQFLLVVLFSCTLLCLFALTAATVNSRPDQRSPH